MKLIGVQLGRDRELQVGHVDRRILLAGFRSFDRMDRRGRREGDCWPDLDLSLAVANDICGIKAM